MKKILAIIISVMMIMTMVPSMAFAESADASKAVATVGDKYYDNLQDALDEAPEGGSVVLIDSVKLDESIVIKKSVTLDLRDFTISNSENNLDTKNYLIHVNTANDNDFVAIIGGNIESDIRGIKHEKGELCLMHLSIECKKRGLLVENATAHIEKTASVSIKEGGDDAPVIVWGNGDYKKENIENHPTLYVAGKVDATKSKRPFAAVQGQGTDRSYTKIIINDGAYLKSNGVALYLPQAGRAEVAGGTLEGESAVGVKSGLLSVSGGNLIAKGEYVEDLESTSGGINSDGSVINVDSNGGYAGEIMVDVCLDANLTSTNAHAIREVGSSNETKKLPFIQVRGGKLTSAAGKDCFNVSEVLKLNKGAVATGGIFSTDPTEYIHDEIGFVEDLGDGTYRAYSMAVYGNTELELNVGETYDIETVVADKDMNFTVCDANDIDKEGPKGVIEVDENGVVKALSPGKVGVRCQVKDNGKFTPAGIKQLVTFTVKGNSSVPSVPSTPEPEVVPPTVDAGGNIETTVKPDESGKVETTVPSETITESLDKVTQSPSTEKPVVEIVVKEEAGAKPAGAVDVKVPAEAVDKIAKTEDATLKVTTSVGTVELDNKALNKVAAEANGETVTITVENKDVSEIVNDAQKETIETLGKEDHVFELTVKVGDRKIHELGGEATFEIHYELKEGELAENVRVYYIDNEGKKHRVESTYNEESNKIVMTTDHFSIFAVSYVDAPSKVKVLKANNEKGKAALKWSRATNGADGYRVYRAKTKDGKYSPIAWVKDGKAKTFKEKSKKTNKTYYYKVRAYKNVDGKKVWGDYSPVKKIKF